MTLDLIGDLSIIFCIVFIIIWGIVEACSYVKGWRKK